MKKNLSLFFLLCNFCIIAQEQRLMDSLLSLVRLAKDDTGKVRHLNKLCFEYRQVSQVEPGLSYGIRALALGQKLNYKLGIAEAYTNMGTLYNLHDYYTEALKNYFLAVGLRKEAGDKKNLAQLYNNIGVVYRKQGNYPQALKYHFMSLKMKENIKDRPGIAFSYNNIGNIYLFQSNYGEALKMYRAGLRIMKEVNDKNGIASSYNNIGNAYENQGDYPEALENYVIALKAYEEIYDKEGMANLYGNIGVVYDHLGERQEALKNYLASLKIEEEIGDMDGMAITYLNVGTMYTALHNMKEAEKFLNRSLKISKEIGNKQLISDCYDYLSELDSAKGDYRSAFAHQKMFIQYKDSLVNEENTRKTIHLQVNYEFEKRQDSLRAEQDKKDVLTTVQSKVKDLQLSRGRYMLGGVSVLLVMSFATGFLFIRQNKLKSQQQSVKLEQKLLRSQMNPHFIFNSLIAIESFIYKNEPREAGRYLSGFAKLMRAILENSREEYVTLEREMSTLKHYLELQKLRFEERFSYSIEAEEDIDTESVAVPPMLAQPFIENSIEHGIKNSGTRGLITIRFSKKGEDILFEVQDNGIGLERSEIIKVPGDKHKSLATVITNERLALLNKGKSSKVKILIDALTDEAGNVTGTRVSFLIPFREI